MVFKPGQSGNPSGRRVENSKVKELARAHTETAINTLVEITTNARAAAVARVTAATALLDRGWGKPTQPLANDEDNPLFDPAYAESRLIELCGKVGINLPSGSTDA